MYELQKLRICTDQLLYILIVKSYEYDVNTLTAFYFTTRYEEEVSDVASHINVKDANCT